MPGVSADASPSPEPEAPVLGEKTASAILGILQETYRQELASEEDVHRTLPFFATALGLILTALNYATSQLPSWSAVRRSRGQDGAPASIPHAASCAWASLLAELCWILVICLSAAVLWYLFLATRKQNYIRIGPEREMVSVARQLHDFHVGRDLSAEAVDTATVMDVRALLLEPYANAVMANRSVNLQRYHCRAMAVLCLLLSLLFALIGTIFVALSVKFGL